MADEQTAGDQPESAEATAPAQLFAPPPSLAAAPSAYPWNPLGDPEYVALDKASRELIGKQHEAVMGGVGELEAMQADMPQAPQLEKAPQEPKAQLGQGLMQYMQVATVLGALAGGLARGNTTAALNAFSGAIKGFTEGRREDFESKMEEWKAASTRVKEDNQAKLDQYKMVYDNKKMTIEEKRTALKMIAAQYQDEITFNSLEQGHILQAAQIYEKGVQQQKSLEEHDMRMRVLAQKLEDAIAQHQTNMDSEADRYIDGIPGAGSGFARSPAMKAQWLKTVDERLAARGLTNQDIANNKQAYAGRQREQVGVGTRAANISIAIQDAKNIIPYAESANATSQQQGKRSGFASWNKVTNNWNAEQGDENYTQLVNYTNSVIGIYARARGGGGQATDALRAEGHAMLDPNMPPQAYAAALGAIKNELSALAVAPEQVREQMRTGKEVPAAPMRPAPNAAPATDEGWGELQVK